MAIGGPLESVSIDGRTFAVTGDADVNRKLGGKENEVQMNGNGTGRVIQTPIPSGFTGVVVECDDSRDDQEYLEGIQNSGLFVPVSATYASGSIYQGSCAITGELQFSNISATCQFGLQGAGPLTPQ